MLRSVSMIVSGDNSNGGHAFKGRMMTIDGGDYVIRYLTRRDMIAISEFEDMVKPARQLSSWSMA